MKTAGATRDQVFELLEPSVVALGYELVDVELNLSRGHGLVRLFIDADAGITLEDCEQVSHQVSGVLDVENPIASGYRLEVSSPGLDRKLVKPEHFDRFAGELIKARLKRLIDGRRRVQGQLVQRQGERIQIRSDEDEIWIALADIDVARLVPQL
jgi:ribosome maturation factor RimP